MLRRNLLSKKGKSKVEDFGEMSDDAPKGDTLPSAIILYSEIQLNEFRTFLSRNSSGFEGNLVVPFCCLSDLKKDAVHNRCRAFAGAVVETLSTAKCRPSVVSVFTMEEPVCSVLVESLTPCLVGLLTTTETRIKEFSLGSSWGNKVPGLVDNKTSKQSLELVGRAIGHCSCKVEELMLRTAPSWAVREIVKGLSESTGLGRFSSITAIGCTFDLAQDWSAFKRFLATSKSSVKTLKLRGCTWIGKESVSTHGWLKRLKKVEVSDSMREIAPNIQVELVTEIFANLSEEGNHLEDLYLDFKQPSRSLDFRSALTSENCKLEVLSLLSISEGDDTSNALRSIAESLAIRPGLLKSLTYCGSAVFNEDSLLKVADALRNPLTKLESLELKTYRNSNLPPPTHGLVSILQALGTCPNQLHTLDISNRIQPAFLDALAESLRASKNRVTNLSFYDCDSMPHNHLTPILKQAIRVSNVTRLECSAINEPFLEPFNYPRGWLGVFVTLTSIHYHPRLVQYSPLRNFPIVEVIFPIAKTLGWDFEMLQAKETKQGKHIDLLYERMAAIMLAAQQRQEEEAYYEEEDDDEEENDYHYYL